VKEAVDIVLREPKYQNQLEDIRRWIGELEELLFPKGSSQKHVNEFKQQLAVPSLGTAINAASSQLAIRLEQAWTCSNTNHGSHNAVLRFDAQLDWENNVHTNIAISCWASDSQAPKMYVSNSWIEVPLYSHIQTPRTSCLAPCQKRRLRLMANANEANEPRPQLQRQTRR
jgi:hypothetical protein